VAQGARSVPNRWDSSPTRRVDGRIVSTPLGSEERVFGPRNLPKVLSEPVTAPIRAAPPPLVSESAPSPPRATGKARRSGFGLILAGVATLAAAAGIGGWWFVRSTPAPESATMASPVERTDDLRPSLAPEPVPAPEPRPAPEPAPAPEPHPAPEPRPAPRLKPESGPRSIPASPHSAPSSPPGSRRNLDDELKSQFDPTLQDLERGLRR